MIYRETDYDECFKDEYTVEPEIISDGDEFEEKFGVDYALLTDEHIKALQQGKVLCIDINCGEYSCLLKKEVERTVENEKRATIPKEALISELDQFDVNVLKAALAQARYYTLFGVDVTKKWDTATEQAHMLDSAYVKGFHDGLAQRLKGD